MISQSDSCYKQVIDVVNKHVNITEEKISTIESTLLTYERVSLIFLLNDDSSSALESVQNEINLSLPNLVSSWCGQMEKNSDKLWKCKLLESLTLIQNYRILKYLGVDYQFAINIFKPNNLSTSFTVNPYKKMMYYLCEKLTPSDFDKLVKRVEEGSMKRRPKFYSEYLEGYLLRWNSELKLISFSQHGFPILLAHLKPVNSDLANKLSTMLNGVNNDQQCEMKQVYKIIDYKNVGLCIIINQENFRPEMGGKRKGTENDCDRLKKTMEAYNFSYHIEKDLLHYEICGATSNLIKEKFKPGVHSVIMVVILSHGADGVIYGVNHIPDSDCSVKIDEIKDVFHLDILENIPKILIIQACQGNYLNKTEVYQTDGPSTVQRFKKAHVDLIECYSTVPKFISIRDPKNGGWYIQALCETMETKANEDFHTLLIHVNDALKNDRKYSANGIRMVPQFRSTLTKKLFLKIKT